MTLSSPAIFHVTARKKKSRVRATAVVNKDIKVVTAQTVATTTTRVEVITIERDVDTRICGVLQWDKDSERNWHVMIWYENIYNLQMRAIKATKVVAPPKANNKNKQ